MALSAASLMRFAATSLATLIIGFSAIWGAFALWYQAPGGQSLKTLSVLLWAGFALILLIAPSNDRIWADDVAQMTAGTADGNRVTLRNVRNFEWRSDTDYTQRWETRDYDLERLNSVDMIMSYWNGPAIAHMLISFGFEDGDHVVFSVEIRREKRETFSEIGGFFNEFALSVIAADERDVIRVRTNVRGEDAYLYRIRLPPAAMRSLFLSYTDEANALLATP